MDPQSSSEALTESSETRPSHNSAATLRGITPARVSLAQTGVSITTRDTLAFALDHAQARDAVHTTLSVPTMMAELQARGLKAIAVKSAAEDRSNYLRRPDLGRTLNETSRTALKHARSVVAAKRLTIIVADGLSALATDRNALAVIDALLRLIPNDWELTEIVVAEQARVSLGDEIGASLGAQATVMLIGERPGLSSADSLGVYITWAPRVGCSNAERNCISNIRDGGLGPADAAVRIAFYLREATRLQATGTALKDPEAFDLLR